jgi:predicted nucleotidyltransferase
VSETVHPKRTLADALFTATQQRVLGLLFGHPERSFFATELIHLAHVGSGAVQRELRRLSEGGLVRVFYVGNQKHYQANPDSPIFEELCGIIEKTVGLIEPLHAALKALQDRIELAVLYGSVAKGADHAGSDIDLLIVSDDLALEECYAALSPAEDRLLRKINPTLYTRAEFERRRESDNSFLIRVFQSKHVVLIGSDHDSR